jgi:hypothetical protein
MTGLGPGVLMAALAGAQLAWRAQESDTPAPEAAPAPRPF